MSDLVKARRLVAEIVADREEGTEDAWWHSNVSDFVLDESYGEHGGQNGADRRRILRVPAVERALIAALDLTGVEVMDAENKRLREALISIDALDPEQQIDGFSVAAMRGLILRIGEIARAALKETDNG